MLFHATASILAQTSTVLVISCVTDSTGFIDMWALVPPAEITRSEPFLILMLLADRESVLLGCPNNTQSNFSKDSINFTIDETSDEFIRFVDSSLLTLPVEEAYEPMRCPSG